MPVSFADHVSLLGRFLDGRHTIVDAIESRLLNVRDKDLSRTRDRGALDHVLNSCFFNAQGVPRELSRLKGQLAAAHVADGFEPVQLDNYSQELDPLQIVARAYLQWDHERWPGKSGRLTFAEAVFSVFVLRQLEQLSLRIWDDGVDRAGDRLRDVQRLLDRLNERPRPGAFVRDAAWLVQTAQGPLTRHLGPYFTIAEQIDQSFRDAAGLPLHKAGAMLAGGHLRSQLRYRVWNSQRPPDDVEVLAFTRNSNSMDVALLVRDLVPLLEAYQTACSGDDVEVRLELADAILQGLSADPELLLTRLDLLSAYTTVEHLFVERGGDGRARYTTRGEAHARLVARYGTLVGNLASSLSHDASTFEPSGLPYAPLGIAYGFVADVLANMAMDTLHSHPSFDLSLEDMFTGRGRLDDKAARARGWAALPTREGERPHFDHAIEWAAQVFARLVKALDARARHGTRANASEIPGAKLFVVPESASVALPSEGFVPADVVPAQEHCFVSDLNRALSTGAISCPKHTMVIDRNEGRFLASAESDGTWFGISKVILTLITSQGKDALIVDTPPAAIEALRLTCPGLIVTEE